MLALSIPLVNSLHGPEHAGVVTNAVLGPALLAPRLPWEGLAGRAGPYLVSSAASRKMFILEF